MLTFQVFAQREAQHWGRRKVELRAIRDDLVEGPSVLRLDLYPPGPPGITSCAPAGAPVGRLVVTIVDHDEAIGIAALEVDGSEDGLQRETGR